MPGFDLSLLAVFTPAWWLSIGLGVGIGVLYSVSSLLLNRYAIGQGQHRFMLIVVGGMVGRMGITLALVALILLLLPVEQIAFFGSFFGVFVTGLIVEVLSMHRRLPAGKDT